MKIGKKTILLLVLGLIGLCLIYQLGYWAIWTPWQQRFAREEDCNRRIKLYTASLNRVPSLKADWQSLGERTYGVSRGQMIDRMNLHLQGVLDGSASGSRDLKLTASGSTPMIDVKPPTAMKNGSAEVQAIVTGVGKVEACFRVLYELSHSPHLARVENASIEKVSGESYKLYVECIAKWLEQPTIKGVRNGKLVDVKFDFKPVEQNRLKSGPFSGSEVASKLGSKTMFTMWQEPRKEIVERIPARIPETQKEVIKTPEIVIPPPPRDHPERWTVTAIYPPTREQPARAHLLDVGDKKAWWVQVGDKLWDGTITEINLDGYLVMRTTLGGEYFVVEANERKKVADRVRRQDYQTTPALLSN